jgi:hypothetical protein
MHERAVRSFATSWQMIFIFKDWHVAEVIRFGGWLLFQLTREGDDLHERGPVSILLPSASSSSSPVYFGDHVCSV